MADEGERIDDSIAQVALHEEYSSSHIGSWMECLVYSISESLSLLHREWSSSGCSAGSPCVEESESLSRSTSISHAQRAMLPSKMTPSA
jgi:hypothetical protein